MLTIRFGGESYIAAASLHCTNTHIFLESLLDISEGKQESELSTGPPYINKRQFD
jgi:hypothetical protein